MQKPDTQGLLFSKRRNKKGSSVRNRGEEWGSEKDGRLDGPHTLLALACLPDYNTSKANKLATLARGLAPV
jgi:hypothetical protein